MRRVVFAVPYAMESTLRFLRAALEVPEAVVGVVSQEEASRLPAELRARLAGHLRVPDMLDARALEAGVRRLGAGLGGVDRLLGILEQLQEPMAEVRERLRIPGMGVEEARNFRDKARMKDLLRQHGLPCAGHGLARSRDEALALAEEIGFPLIVKPPAGAGARQTFRVEDAVQLQAALRAWPVQAGEPVLLEEFITGREHSFDSVSLHGRHLFHSISVYSPTPLEVVEQPWLQWAVLLPRDISGPEFEDIRRAGPAALDVLGMVTGMTHMEWFRRTDGSLAISEVAARPPGAQFTSLLSWAHDRDFYRVWAELQIHERFEPPPRLYAAGAVYLRGQGGRAVAGVRGFEELRRELGDLVVEGRLPRPGQPRSTGYEGEGYLILRHPETRAVEEGMRRILERVKVETV